MGGLAKWFTATVSKTVLPQGRHRFESCILRNTNNTPIFQGHPELAYPKLFSDILISGSIILYMDINNWLDNFRKNWINHDVDGVLDLFADNVEYFESPFMKLDSRVDLESVWNGIQKQENIELSFVIFSSKEDHFTVMWDLRYESSGTKRHFAGTYLIKLNKMNLCTYFYHCCESEKL